MALRAAIERRRRGWSLRDLELRTGISASTLSRLERGLMPSYPGWTRRLAVILHVKGEKLFEEVEQDKREPVTT